MSRNVFDMLSVILIIEHTAYIFDAGISLW